MLWLFFMFTLFALLILFWINTLTNSLVTQREIPDERQQKVFRTINVLITILLVSSYVEVLLA
ncbi:hypothetical protein [Litoribacterium kuwaitense]|uniref:hypothetical protein n=1 Tax=Litoribacterium kuwaitense TaxID=1398745 RepID=UPI001BACDEC5|nr:hypothetical protein [Litoribacterium kuwaitense]